MFNCNCDMALFAYADWLQEQGIEITEAELFAISNAVSGFSTSNYYYGWGYSFIYGSNKRTGSTGSGECDKEGNGRVVGYGNWNCNGYGTGFGYGNGLGYAYGRGTVYENH